MAELKGWTSVGDKVFGTYGSGTTSDKTNFESKVFLKRAGKNQASKKVSGSEGGTSIVWQDAKHDDELHWTAKTLCDNDPTADRVNVVLSYYDPTYLGQLSDQIIKTLNDSELEQVMAGDSSVIEKKLETMLDINRALKQVYSTTVVTDKDGIAEGVIPLPADYPYSEYTLTMHYGYSGLAERTDSDKAWDFWLNEVGIMVLEIVLIIIATALTGGAALAFGIAATVVGVADLALMASQYTSNGFGAIDENNRGCLFPATGWNHSYAIVLNEPVPEEEGGGNEISNEIFEQISVPEATQEKANQIMSDYSFAQIAIVGSATLAAIMLLLFGGRKK
tara:strand:- start:3290 stop:4294 length:1005 start_codon:yes stop_codon:yes gene_type:complete